MWYRNETGIHCYLYFREYLPAFYAGRIWNYKRKSEVIKAMESIIIGIAGGSGSGKSTFTNRIKKHFGDDVVLLDLNGAFFDGSVHLSLS